MNFFLTKKAAQTALNNQFARFVELLLKSLEKKPHDDKGPLPGFDIRHVSETCILLGIDGYALYSIDLLNNPSTHKRFSLNIQQVGCVVKLNEAIRNNFGLNSLGIQLNAIPVIEIFDQGYIYRADLTVDNMLTMIENITNQLRNDVMEIFARAISRHQSMSNFELDYESYYSGLRITLEQKHIKHEIDTRFMKMNNVYARNSLEVDDYPTPQLMIDGLNEVNEKFQRIVDDHIAKYTTIMESVGGTELILDNKLILTHRDFDPIVTGGFITFMCPYTKSMISMKSTNIECIEVRKYGRGQLSEPVPTSIVAISHQ